MLDELQNCPFCNSGANIDKTREGLFYVVCSHCRCRTRAMNDKENAINTWNRRLNSED